MTPCIVIPTFWTRRKATFPDRLLNIYGHPTPVDEDGPLPECLSSIERTCADCRIVVLVATTDPSIEVQAEERIDSVVADFPGLDTLVFGPAELGSLHRRMEQLEFSDMIQGATLLGYGAVRNAGLIVAATLASEVVIFIDDDQVVVDEDFLDRALWGLGRKTQKGTPVLAKTGFYVDREGEYRISSPERWYDVAWRQVQAYNAALSRLMSPPRLRRSPIGFGGCMAIHADMYRNVSFDPWVVRGEDVDYVLNVKMHGGDLFLDNEWSIVHQPPASSSQALGFRQDVYRFVYEHRKLEFAKSQVDLRPVSMRSLAPFPGDFVGHSVAWRAFATGILRAAARQEPGAYLKVAREALTGAPAYARQHCQDYFAFQRRWPILMDRIWDDIALRSLFTGERRLDKSALTGRFPTIRDT